MGAMCLPLPVGASPLDQDSSWRSNVEIVQNADPDLEIFVLVLRKKLAWFWIVWSWLFRFFLSPFWHNKAWFRYIWSLFWRKIVLHTGCIVLHCATSCYIVYTVLLTGCGDGARWGVRPHQVSALQIFCSKYFEYFAWNIYCVNFLVRSRQAKALRDFHLSNQSFEGLWQFQLKRKKKLWKGESSHSEAKIKLRREALVTKAGLWPHFSKLWKHSGVGKG